MKTKLIKGWDYLRSSFWFLPSVMVTAAAALAFGAVAFDEHITLQSLKAWGWVYSGGAEGASAVLQTIASSMVAITGVVFSMTLVALTLASSQYGPRLLRNFMRDTSNQAVLGVFISTFLYCLLVLRSIRRADEIVFVPHVAVTLGLVFAGASICVLIYFIHHVAVSIQVDEIVARVGSELQEGIVRLFPREIGVGQPSSPAPPLPDSFATSVSWVTAATDNYVQLVDADTLLALAEGNDAVFRVERPPGAYVSKGTRLLAVWPSERLTDEFAAQLRGTFVLGNQRTPTQDIAFPLHELVEIALRALSPGINDPFTALTCIDRLGSALIGLAGREMPSPARLDAHQKLRLVVPVPSFRELVDQSFDQIRQSARSNHAVSLRLLETLAAIGASTELVDCQAALQRQADMIIGAARETLPELEDRHSTEIRYRSACEVFQRVRSAAVE
jgi:uncharacterized membrane protein